MDNNINKLQTLITQYPNAQILCKIDKNTIKKLDNTCNFIGKLINIEYIDNCYIYNDIYFDNKNNFIEFYMYDNINELFNKFQYNPFITAESQKDVYDKNVENKELLDNYLKDLADSLFYSAIIISFK